MLLKQLDCESAQGYFYSRPADDKAMYELLNKDRDRLAAAASR